MARNASSGTNGSASEEHQRAAIGYLIWPLALIETVRASNATLWSRLHARQALIFGIAATVGYGALLIVPFLAAVVFGASLGTRGTIVVYSLCLAADAIAAVALTIAAVRYSLRAARGELFAIRFVSAASDRWFRIARTEAHTEAHEERARRR